MPWDEKTLNQLAKRRHPEYEDFLPHWTFLEACYRGGRQWFSDNVFRYIKEGEKEFEDRLKRAYRFNHSREIVDLVNKYIFKVHASRAEDAPACIRDFQVAATRSGQPIDQFMRNSSKMSSIFGRIWIVVDNVGADGVRSVADAKKAGLRTYTYAVRPKHVLDMSFDEEGKLNWILIHEIVRDDADPFTSGGGAINRYRLWTRTRWELFEEQKKGGKSIVKHIDGRDHGLGRVPVIKLDHVESDDLYTAPSLIGDIAYLDRAVANYLSNLDAIIQDQTFSQLAMPAQSLISGEEAYDKLVEMGTKRVFLFDGEGGRPEYLSPDPKQAELIITAIRQIVNEIYHTVGMAGERTKQDNSMGIDNSSGVAKAYDFERVNALLTSKADALERAENEINELVCLWNGVEHGVEPWVTYPETFDVRGLADEFDVAERLALIDAPELLRQEQMELLVDKLMPQLATDVRERIKKQIKEWPPKAEPNTSGTILGRPGGNQSQAADGQGDSE